MDKRGSEGNRGNIMEKRDHKRRQGALNDDGVAGDDDDDDFKLGNCGPKVFGAS